MEIELIDATTTNCVTPERDHFSERELTFTFAICYRRSIRLSVVMPSHSSVCNVRAPYSVG